MPDDIRLCIGGQVVLDAGESFSDATVRVRLEDVTNVGAPSVTVSEQVIHAVSHQAGSRQQLPFVLSGQASNPRARYNVRAHIDVDGDGLVSVGDYVSTQSHPVTLQNPAGLVTVRVSRVS